MTAVCPACVAGAPAAEDAAARVQPKGEMLLHLPGIHCAGCMSGVERALLDVPGVKAARVNLTLKRAFVDTDGGVPGEALIEALAHAGYAAQELDAGLLAAPEDRLGRDLLMRLGVAGFAMMNVMLLSIAVWSGAADSTRTLFHLISAAIAVPAVIFSGRPFFVSALGVLKVGRLNMDVPISLAILLATGVSVVEAVTGSAGHAWFDAALSLTFFLLAGRVLDQSGRRAARSAARALSALDVPKSLKVTAEGERSVSTTDLAAGDVIRVLPGMRVAVDGTVTEGYSALDRAPLTGETRPIPVEPGVEVHAGEENLSGPLLVRVDRAGEDTALARMGRLIAEAENARSAYASIADKAAQIYAPLVHILSALAFVGWFWATHDFKLALGVAVAVLVITCPCAIGLAVPAVSVTATGKLFRLGMLVKSRTALERLAEVDTVAFDKTGTLTQGKPELVAALPDAALALAMGLAEGSAHPLSRAILAAGAARGVSPAEVTDRTEVAGRGVEGTHAGRKVRLVRPDLAGLDTPEGSAVALEDGQGDVRLIPFRDAPRHGAAEAVAALKAQGLRVLLISGDADAPVRDLAQTVGIDEAHARLTPEDKCAVLDRLAEDGRTVLMVGDGLNDAAALASAHASIAPASALDAARAAADVVLLSPSLAPVPEALITARAAQKLMRQNIFLSAAYNVIAVPLALMGIATPLMAAIAMSASSITVSLNALRAGR